MLSFCNMAALCEAMMLGTATASIRGCVISTRRQSNASELCPAATEGFYDPPSSRSTRLRDLHLASSWATMGVPLQRAPRRTTCSAWPRAGLGPEDSTSSCALTMMLKRKVNP